VKLTRAQIAALSALFAGLVVLYLILARTVHAPPLSLANLKAEKAHPAAEVHFVDAQGARRSLREFRGRYVLLNLWGTWCAPCAKELPALSRLSARIPQLAVVAVALPPGSADEAKAFLESHGAGSLGAFFDSESMFFRSFRAYALPVTILIDPNGNEVARAIGPAKWDAPDATAYLRSEVRQKAE
jgi:thiol-disulfide isomerase/thioredoxin